MQNEKIRHFNLKELIPFVGVVAVILCFQVITQGKLLTNSNIQVILNTLFTYLLVSVGATFVYTAGGMDMSVGALLAVCGLMVSVGMNMGSPLLGLALAILLGIVSGVINGGVQALWGIPPFVMSLCLRYIYRGVIVTVSESFGNIKVPAVYRSFDNFPLKVIVLAVVFAIAAVLFNYTRVGKSAKAIGGNPTAAAQAGIRVTQMKILTYIITGICVALAAFFSTARQVGVSSDTGNGLELNVMVAVVIGGLGIRGGARAKLRCCVIGSIIVAVLNNGLVLAGIPATLVEGIKGVLFLIVVYLTYERRMGDVVN